MHYVIVPVSLPEFYDVVQAIRVWDWGNEMLSFEQLPGALRVDFHEELSDTDRARLSVLLDKDVLPRPNEPGDPPLTVEYRNSPEQD